MPYHVAQYWERGLRQHAEEARAAAAVARKRAAGVRRVAPGVEVGLVPRELRATAKKTPALRSWVRVLEEPVRQFLEEARRAELEGEGEMDSEDEEIVFVGRNGSTRDGWKKARREVQQRKVDEGVVFDSADGGESGAFKSVSRLFPWCDEIMADRGTPFTGAILHIPSRATTASIHDLPRLARHRAAWSTSASRRPRHRHRDSKPSCHRLCGSYSEPKRSAPLVLLVDVVLRHLPLHAVACRAHSFACCRSFWLCPDPTDIESLHLRIAFVRLAWKNRIYSAKILSHASRYRVSVLKPPLGCLGSLYYGCDVRI